LENPAKEIAAKLGSNPALVRKHIAVIKTLPPNELPLLPMKRPSRKRVSTDRLDNRLRHYDCKRYKNEVPDWENISPLYPENTTKEIGYAYSQACYKARSHSQVEDEKACLCQEKFHLV
jgi:hypothetical protein